MNKRLFASPFYLVILLLGGVLTSCVEDPPPVPELKLGGSTELGTIDVPIAGTTASVTYNSKTLHVIIPPNSFTEPKTLHILKTTISSQTFGGNVKPVSDLLTIDFGGDYPAHNIIVEIPNDESSINFTMGFYYDKQSRDLEAIPLCTFIPGYTRIAVRHSGDLFLSSIPISQLYGGYETKFSIATDGSDIPNFGTSFTPTGQFAGTTLSTLWYYFEQASRGQPHLYGLYNSALDSGNAIWQDNTKGIFLATETENALNWAANSASLHEQLVSSWNEITIHELTYAMMVTGKPQMLSMRESNKGISVPTLVYKLVDSNAYIYDPNFPKADNRKLSLKQRTGPFYVSGSSLNDIQVKKGKSYIVFTFLGDKALVDWSAISTSYQKALSDTIIMPALKLNPGPYGATQVANGWENVFEDTVSLTLTNPKDSLTKLFHSGIFTPYPSGSPIALSKGDNLFGVLSEVRTSTGYNVWNGFNYLNIKRQSFSITTASHVSMVENDIVLHSFFLQKLNKPIQYEWNMGDGSPTIKNRNIDSIDYRYKTPGTYTITLSIYDVATSSLMGTETTTITITLNPVAIFPKKILVPIGAPCSFSGPIVLPKDIKIRREWDMGDGSMTNTTVDRDSILYAFKTTGTFVVRLKIFDNENNVLLGIAQDSITLIDNLTLDKLKTMSHVSIRFFGDFQGALQDAFLFGGSPATWTSDGTFHTSWSYSGSDPHSTDGSMEQSMDCKGTVATNCSSVLNFTCNFLNSSSYSSSDGNFGATNETHQLSGKNVPLVYVYPDSIIYEVTGPETKDYLNTIKYTYSSFRTHGSSDDHGYTSTNWNSTKIPPILRLKFFN